MPYRTTPTLRASILKKLNAEANQVPFTSLYIASLAKLSKQQAQKVAAQMVKNGELERTEEGQLRLPRREPSNADRANAAKAPFLVAQEQGLLLEGETAAAFERTAMVNEIARRRAAAHPFTGGAS